MTREELETSERRYRGLFADSATAMAIADLDGRFVDANEAFLGLIGLPLDELLGRQVTAFTHPDDRTENARLLDDLVQGRRSSFSLRKRYLVGDDEVVWARVAVSTIRGVQGDSEYLVATIEDISEHRLSEQRLQRGESLLRVAGELAQFGGWSLEADTGKVEWSDELFKILGVDGRTPPSLDYGMSRYVPGSRELVEAALDACFSAGTPFDLEVEIDRLDGRRIAARLVGEAERGPDGRVQRILGAFQDVTEVRRANHRASELARRLAATVESMTDALCVVDRHWRFTLLNRRAEELLRRSRQELLGRVVWEEFPEARETVVFEAFHEAMRTGESSVIEELHYPPLGKWFEVHVHPTTEGLAVYFRDVSERRAALTELAARESQLARQAALLDAASDAIYVRDLDHVVRYWNDSSHRLYGYRADEAVGADIRDLLYDSDALEHDALALEAAERELRRVGEWSGELPHRTRAGARLIVESRWTLVHDDHGAPDAVLEVNTDVTERRVLEQQHLRAQRMESLGTLAGGIAHDLNNMLSPILLASELLQADEDDEWRLEILRTVYSSARRGADLVTQVLSFARGIEGTRQAIAVSDLVSDLERIVGETFPRQIVLRTDVPDELPQVMGDVTQLGQVLLNLALNARDAMGQGGVLRLSVATADLDGHYVGLNPLASVGEHVIVEVEDDGTGMPAEVTERIFEPFFTTKPHGSGTGLGLSTASAIVRSHDGFIQVYSEPGHGTTFRVYLPVANAETPPAPASLESSADLQRGDGAGVLVVDDEAAVREVIRQTLEAYGYRVLEASDGAQAVSVFAHNRDEIDIVLTDMTMPIMDGPAAIHALRRLDAGLKIVGASGLHGDGKVALAAAAGVKHFLPKPYTASRLLGILHAALRDEPGPGR